MALPVPMSPCYPGVEPRTALAPRKRSRSTRVRAEGAVLERKPRADWRIRARGGANRDQWMEAGRKRGREKGMERGGEKGMERGGRKGDQKG